MSIESTLERVAALRQTLADPAALISASTGGTAAPVEGGASEPSFAAALRQAGAGVVSPVGVLAPGGTPSSGLLVPGGTPSSVAPGGMSPSGVLGAGGLTPTSLSSTSPVGARIVAIAESQLGQAEQPPGSNESPAIAMYRTATAGAMPGEPWCAYFASWASSQAGEPIGAGGQGAGSVAEVWSWAQSVGRAIPNGPGVVPKAGDLIVFGDQHVGIVRGVLPNGGIQTIEGNYENKVSANVRSPTEATGYVSMS
jgi:hypothetical protein